MPLRISVAGLVEIAVDDVPVEMDRLGRIGRLFWVYLVSERRRPVAKDELAEVLWGEDQLPRSWEQMLRGNASKLRSILATAGMDPAVALSSAFGAYQVRLPSDAVVDVEEAQANLERAIAALGTGNAKDAYRAAAASVAVAARRFMPGWSGVWVDRREAELRELHLRGLDLLAQAAVATGQWADAIAAAEQAVGLEPFRESAHQALMAAHRGAGNPAEGLRAYERCRRVLAEELGASPSAATESIYISLLSDEAPPETSEDSRIPLPLALAPTAHSFLVGRKTESDHLRGALERATSTGRQVVLVAGEPGMGKTTLVSDFAREAHASGARVLYGRCDEELGVAYQPFAEALGHYVAHCPLPELGAHVDTHGAEVSRVAPELMRRLPDQPPLATGSDGDRYRLFQAVADLVDRATHRGPLLLVLDDLHWAAPPTLALLRHVARARTAPLVVIGTYRHTEVGADHPLAATLADLWREPGVERIVLEGLEEEGVSAFVERTGSPDGIDQHALARALHARTAGNPFFVGEFLRYVAETGVVYRRDGTWSYYEDSEHLGVPEGVRDVLSRRLGRLSEPANRVLTMASVIGAEFDLALLEHLTGPAGDDVALDALDQAVEAQVVVEMGTGHYRFAHALVRETIYSALTATRRARLHHHVGNALASLPGDHDVRLPSLAHHFVEAAADGAATEAGNYALTAARQAFDKSAWEDVLVYVKSGLDVLSPAEPAHLALRFELVLLRYETLMIVPDFRWARMALLDAVETAQLLGSPEQLARATSLYLLTGRIDTHVAEVAHETLQGLGESAPHLRARLMAGLAVSARHNDARGAETTARTALALARESGDTDAVHAALVGCKWFVNESPRASEWLALEDELVTLGTVSGPVAGPSRWFHSLGRTRALARLTLGDRARFEDDAGTLKVRSGELQNPAAQWNDLLWRGTLALLDGRFGEVEALASAHLDLVSIQVDPWAIQMGKLALEQGRAGEFESEMVRISTAVPGNTALRAMLACTHAETGRHDAAHRIFEELAADDFRRVLRGMTSTGFAYVAETVVALGQVDLAERVYQLYLPYSGLAAVSGLGAHCPGAVDRYLGQLAATLGRWDEAEAHYIAAIELETGLRSPPLLARTRYWYGRMLLQRGRPGDAERARSLLKSAVETAEGLGMARLAAQASELS